MRLLMVFHNHRPVGNDPGMIEQVAQASFRPLLAALEPAGLCYLPSSPYREMEEWALPPQHTAEISRLKAQVGADAERFSPCIRGSHWKQFFIRYPEANRAHKRMLAWRALLPQRARWLRAWQDLYAAQCNEAYWHGWFGGVYLPLLRHQTWIRLARVERAIRRGQPLRLAQSDLDLDGRPGVWVHAAAFSATVQPHRGPDRGRLRDDLPGARLRGRLAGAGVGRRAVVGADRRQHPGKGVGPHA